MSQLNAFFRYDGVVIFQSINLSSWGSIGIGDVVGLRFMRVFGMEALPVPWTNRCTPAHPSDVMLFFQNQFEGGATIQFLQVHFDPGFFRFFLQEHQAGGMADQRNKVTLTE